MKTLVTPSIAPSKVTMGTYHKGTLAGVEYRIEDVGAVVHVPKSTMATFTTPDEAKEYVKRDLALIIARELIEKDLIESSVDYEMERGRYTIVGRLKVLKHG
jgi:hypothetical protein